MNILIRTDYSSKSGLGHVMRCLTLADSLQIQGAQIKFSCDPCDLIVRRGYDVISPIKNEVEGDLLIVDHYGLDKNWEQKQRKFFDRIFVIDDLAREHDCDILLDQNLVFNYKARYNGKVSEKCKLLLGPEYVLLSPIYTDLHQRIPPREGSVKRVLVSLGGGDYPDLYKQVQEDFLSLNRPEIQLDIVNPRERHVENLASLMAQADLAIAAAGSSSWERLCLGLPSLMIAVADNQKEILEELIRRELAILYTKFALEKILDQGLDQSWSKRCSGAIGTNGRGRVTTVLMTNSETQVRMRYANLKDEDWLFELANDRVTRLNSFSTAPISPKTHRDWFHKKLRDVENCCFYVMENSIGVRIGQVRFEKNINQSWELSYAIAAEFRGIGLGKRMLKLAIEELRSERGYVDVYGHVKPENVASQKIFKSLGLA